MSNNSSSATNDDPTEFSYTANERNYTGIYLNRDFLEDVSIMVPNEPENIGEIIHSNMEVVHTIGQLHQPEQDSEILPGPVIEIDDSNETPPPQLNSETVEPVVKPYYGNNTESSPLPIDNVYYDSNIGNRITQPYVPTNIQHSMPAKQNKDEQFSTCKTVNISQSYSSEFRPPDQNQYCHNDNSLGIQEYDRHSSRIPTSSSNRCESVIKYCKPTQNKFEAFNTSTRDPRLVNRDKNKYFENRLDKYEGLRQIRYTNENTYLNENLRIINMKLKNINSSYRFCVVNNLSSDDNFNEHNIRHRGEPCVKNTQTDRGAETFIDCNKYLKFLNTERQPKINSGKMFDVIDLMEDNGDVAREIEARRTSSVLEQYRIEKTELRKLREDQQKKLAETVENIIDDLNDDTSDLRCTTKILSKKNDAVIKINTLNDQTKNNVEKSNEETLTVENDNFDNTLKNVDICGLIEKNQNNKPLTGQLIETIDLTLEDTADSRIDQNVDTGNLTAKLKDPKIMSMANEQKLEKINKSSKNTEKLNTYKTVKNELINGLDGTALLGYDTSNINKICVKSTPQLIENDQNEIINSIETVIGEPCVGVQSNPNNSTKSTKSATNVVGKIHYTHDDLSIRVQDSRETTESNFTDRSSSYKNRRSSTDLEKRIHDAIEFLHRGTNEDSLKSSTAQSLPSSEQDESGTDVEERRLIGYPENMFNKKPKNYYATSDSSCESNEEQFKIASFKNVDDKQSMSNTGHQNTDTNETNESSENATQSQTTDFMIDILPPVVHRYNSIMDVEKEVSYIKLSEQIVDDNSKSCDEYEFNYDFCQMEQSEDSDDEPVLTIDMQATDTDEPELNEPFEDTTQSQKDCFIGNGKSDGYKDKYQTDPEKSVDITFVDNVLDEDFEIRKLKKGSNNEQNVRSVENQDTNISEFIDDDSQLPNVQRLAGDDVLSADKPPAEQPPADEQIVGEHFEMDYFYNIIKIKPSLFRVNLHNEDDIFNFIQLYSQRTQTNWRVLKSFKSRKYDVCKIFGCLHNGLFKLLKKQDKNIKLNKCECRTEINIKIKCSKIRGKKIDPYLKNGLPAIVRFKNNHNHLVLKVTELPLLKSITDNNVKIKFDNDFEPSKIFQAYNIGSRPNLSPSVVDSSNSSESNVEVVETNNLSTSNQSPKSDLFSKWEDVKIQCYIVETKDDEHLEPGQQIINNGDRNNGTCYQLVDTSYSKEYYQKVRAMITENENTKWFSNKMMTEEDQLSLYKCSGEKCNAVYRNMTTFENHLNFHCHNAKSQKDTCDFMICMYCFKSFDMDNVNALAYHIFDKYSFCKYFCQYCLYRAYTASHVLIHEYIIHKEQKPSILKLQDPTAYSRSREIVKMVDFNQFVSRYVCNIGNCDFYSYLNSDFLNHLSQDHVNCDQFYCDICDKSDRTEFVSLNPTSFVKHFNLHSFNTYQCIFCLFGAEFINLMIIHLAMEHFEYEPLCLERCPINNFCDNKKIENLKILNIKKCIPASIIKVVNAKSLKGLSKKECQINEKRQAVPADTCTNTKTVNIENTTRPSRSDKPIDRSKIYAKYERFYSISQTNEVCQTNPGDTYTNETVKFDNTSPFSRISIKEVVRPSKNTLKPAIGNKKQTFKSDEAKQNIPIDAKRIPNVGASIIKDKRNSSQLSNYNIINNFELKKDIGIPIEGKSLEIPLCEPMDQSMLISNKDKVIPTYISYEDHLNQCPLETPMKCTFCLAQSESTFDVVELSKLPMPNCFACTFCNLELPSTDIAKIHVKEEHNISNVVFVPLDFNATDIEKDRFLVCEGKCLKRQIPANESAFYYEILKNMAITRMKRSKVEKKDDDFQLTTIQNTMNTSRQQIKINTEQSEQSIITTKRKHSIESINIRTVENNIDDCILKFTYTPPSYKPKSYFPQFVPRNKRFSCPLFCNYIGASMENLARHIRYSFHRHTLYYVCLHCRPLIVTFNNLRDLELHLNFHGIELYICQYCDYIHYNRLKIESHQKRKHPFKVDSENKFNIVAIRSSNPDQEIGEWKCNLCMPGIKYTRTQIAAHLSIVHKISNMFKCPMCTFNNDDYYAFERHFKLRHPSMEVKYLNVHFDKITPDVELQPANKQTNVNRNAPSKENHLQNVLEAFDGVAEPTPAFHAPQETTKSLVVSEDQEKILDNSPGELDDYFKLLYSIAKYECPVCNEFVIDEKESFREHLLEEINCTLWKCLECYMLSNSKEQMEMHVKKHNQLKRKFEKIEIYKKNSLVDEIIEYQSIRIEQELYRRNHHHAVCADENGTKV